MLLVVKIKVVGPFWKRFTHTVKDESLTIIEVTSTGLTSQSSLALLNCSNSLMISIMFGVLLGIDCRQRWIRSQNTYFFAIATCSSRLSGFGNSRIQISQRRTPKLHQSKQKTALSKITTITSGTFYDFLKTYNLINFMSASEQIKVILNKNIYYGPLIAINSHARFVSYVLIRFNVK